MKKYFFQICLFLFLFSLTWITFSQSLSFAFWKDDWNLYWGSLYDPKSLMVFVLHPGSFLEFYIFSHIFHLNFFLWNIFGFCLHAGVAFMTAQTVYKLTKSSKAGLLAGVFASVSYFGLETVVWGSAHVVAFSLLIFLISLYYFVLWEEKEKSISLFLIFFLVAIFLDPGRILIAGIIFIFIHTILYQHSLQKLKTFIIPLMLFFLFCIFWVGFVMQGSLLSKMVTASSHNPFFFLRKIHLIYNYFAAVGNIFIGLLFPMRQDVQNTGIYNKLYAVIGFIALFGIFFLTTKKKKNNITNLFILFLQWPFLFYFPNWLFEPRTPMGGGHRYILIAAIGFWASFSYLISFIKNRYLLLVITFLIIAFNVFQAQKILFLERTFRNQELVRYFWSTINSQTPKEKRPYVFILSGNQPLLQQSLQLSGGFPFAIERSMKNKKYIPIITNDLPMIITRLCNGSLSENDLYAWNIFYPSKIINVTNQTRITIMSMKEKACSTL